MLCATQKYWYFWPALQANILENKRKIISMNRKNWYESPALEVVEIAVEAGFSLSGVVGGDDYGDGGYGSEME